MRDAFEPLLFPFAIFSVTTLALLFVRSIALRLLHAWAERTATRADDIVIKAFKTPSIYWSIAIGLYLGISFSAIPAVYLFYLTRALYVILIFSVTIATANLAGRVFRHYVQTSQVPLPTTGLAYALLKGVIIALGFLIILSFLGVSIAPLITALGVGGLAVALALKDTLENLFAGIHILVERSIRVGDFIRLENGQEGAVADITWRTTRIRMLQNNMVVIPNSKLAQSIVTNYSLPAKQMSVAVSLVVNYSADPDRLEQVLLDEAKQAAAEVPGMLADPAPSVRFTPGFGESSLGFTLVCQVREVTDQYAVQHELRKRILKRFRQEGIEPPPASYSPPHARQK